MRKKIRKYTSIIMVVLMLMNIMGVHNVYASDFTKKIYMTVNGGVPIKTFNANVGDVVEINMNSIFDISIGEMYEAWLENLSGDAVISDVNPPTTYIPHYNFNNPKPDGSLPFYFKATSPGTYDVEAGFYETNGVLDTSGMVRFVVTGGDTSKPILSSESVSETSHNATNLNFTSDEAGNYYYLVYLAADTAPNAATVEAQGTAVAKGTSAATASANTVSITGLVASTEYKA